jgi:hypothetical protein
MRTRSPRTAEWPARSATQSAKLDEEINLVARDPELTSVLDAQSDADIERSEEIVAGRTGRDTDARVAGPAQENERGRTGLPLPSGPSLCAASGGPTA